MIAGTQESDDSTRRGRMLRHRCRPKVILAALLFSIIGSLVIVLAADCILSTRLAKIAGTVSIVQPSRDDLRLWYSSLGSLPDSGGASGVPASKAAEGPQELHPDATGSEHGPRDITGVRINTISPMSRVGYMYSDSKFVWHRGVVLPGGMAFQRVCVTRPGQMPPAMSSEAWRVRILPMGLARNTLYLAGPLCVVVVLLVWAVSRYRRIRQGLRLAYGRCPFCSHPLLPDQDICPECGRALSESCTPAAGRRSAS